MRILFTESPAGFPANYDNFYKRGLFFHLPDVSAQIPRYFSVPLLISSHFPHSEKIKPTASKD